jgi:hypothetical protein
MIQATATGLFDKLQNISLSFLYKDALKLGSSESKFIALGMAGSLLHELYGKEWMTKYILNKKNMDTFFNKKLEPIFEAIIQNQILVLGESLYNLRRIEGIINILEKLQNGLIGPIISELESGRLLFQRNLNFKYITRSGQKRKDFDIHVFDNKTDIYCETKCKIESTHFSIPSFQNSLIDAKKQLPLDSPSIILIKIPHNWKGFENELQNFSKSFVEKTNRPLGIVCWQERWETIDSINTLKTITGFEEHNIKSKIINCQSIPFLPTKQETLNWTYFERLASGYL